MKTLRHVTLATELGEMFVAFSDAGLAVLFFGAGEAELRARYPGVKLAAASETERTTAHAVVESLKTGTALPEVKLAPEGTEFQKQVWQALREIPRGETRTYGEIAQRIGRPKAVRAVGTACGANPIALLIPCHRVLRGDGSLSGYRWGVERKKWLLRVEG